MTWTLAQIENNKVLNTVLCDENYAYEFPGYIRVDNLSPQPGPEWTYSNGTFTAPPHPTLLLRSAPDRGAPPPISRRAPGPGSPPPRAADRKSVV